MPRISIAVAVLLLVASAAFAQNVQRTELSINVVNYGAVPNDGNDDTAAFNNAMAAIATWGRIYIPRGIYDINNTITVSKDRIHWEGDGIWATVIRFNPAANDVPVFDFNATGTAPSVQCSLRRLSFLSNNTTFKKIAV
ncbi:MAG TPA: glycosyl hydrolase family 28-related protein, partial [Thermoanaerobaculia bacterium]